MKGERPITAWGTMLNVLYKNNILLLLISIKVASVFSLCVSFSILSQQVKTKYLQQPLIYEGQLMLVALRT